MNTSESQIKNDANFSSRSNEPTLDASTVAVEASSDNGFPLSKYAPFIFIVLAVIGYNLFACDNDVPLSKDTQWRERVDPRYSLTDHQRSTVLASLKPIFDKSANEDEGVSTLLILSSNESTAGKVARCLLDRINTATEQRGVSHDHRYLRRTQPGVS